MPARSLPVTLAITPSARISPESAPSGMRSASRFLATPANSIRSSPVSREICFRSSMTRAAASVLPVTATMLVLSCSRSAARPMPFSAALATPTAAPTASSTGSSTPAAAVMAPTPTAAPPAAAPMKPSAPPASLAPVPMAPALTAAVATLVDIPVTAVVVVVVAPRMYCITSLVAFTPLTMLLRLAPR